MKTTRDLSRRATSLHDAQQACWNDLFAVASRHVAGLSVLHRQGGEASVAVVSGIVHAFSSAFWNQTLLAEPPVCDDLAGLAQRIAALDSLGVPYSVCAPLAEEAVTTAIGALGLVEGPILVAWAARPRRLEADADHPVSRIGAARADDFLATLAPETPSIVRDWHQALVGRPGWDHFVARVDGIPAAGAILYRHARGGYLGWARTLPEFRGRGLQQSLLRARLNRADEKGLTDVLAKILAASVEAAEAGSDANPSARNARRCGLEPIGMDRVWVAKRHAEAIFASIISG